MIPPIIVGNAAIYLFYDDIFSEWGTSELLLMLVISNVILSDILILLSIGIGHNFQVLGRLRSLPPM